MICYLTILIHCIVVGRSLLAEGRVGLYQDLYPSDSIVDIQCNSSTLAINLILWYTLVSLARRTTSNFNWIGLKPP